MKHVCRKPQHKIFSNFKSIRSAMLLSFSTLIITALFIFLIIALRYTEDTVVENSTDYTQQLINQVNADIDSYIQYMKNISTMVTANPDVTSFLFSDGPKQEDPEIRTRVEAQFGTILDARADIYNVGIMSDAGQYLFNYGASACNLNIDITSLDWYQATQAAKGGIVLSSSHVQTLVKADYKWVVTLSNLVNNPKKGQPGGFLFIDLNYSAISDLCENINLGSKGYVFIIDSDGQIVYHPRQQLLYSGIKTEPIKKIRSLSPEESYFITTEDDTSRLYTASTSKQTGWTVVGVANMDDLMTRRNQTQLLYFITAALLLLAALSFSLILSTEITRPIKELQESMQEVEKGNFDTAEITVTGANEIGSLSNSFNIMTHEIQKLMEQNVEEQRQKRRSELKALQAQINPHFLYNTLDSIIWMAETGKNREVVLMTSTLAKLLRQSISNSDEIVTIAKEIEYTKLYLTIQKMRYQDQLEFHINVEPELLQIPVVKLVLQPLVENAIYHGIKNKEGTGTITITGFCNGHEVILEVADNGIGMTPQQLAAVYHAVPSKTKSNGVGISNIHSRLQLYYGKEYGLTFESREHIGTQVFIHLPSPKEEFR